MSLKDMKEYMNLCLKGKESIPERKEMLAKTRDELLAKQKELQEALDYIDDKQKYYDDVLDGKVKLSSYIAELDE
jgi:DNA-binding transcriptional MerR regulator